MLSDWQPERCWNDRTQQPEYAYEQPLGDALLISAELVRRLETADLTDPREAGFDYPLAVRTTELIAEQVEALAGPVVAALREAT